MRIKTLFKENSYTDVYEYFKKKGLKEEDFYDFLNPTREKNVHSPFLLKNMDIAVETVLKHVEKGSVFMVKVDQDVDGFTSTAKLSRYLKKAFPNIKIEYFVPEGKTHGIDDEILKLEFDILISPDGGM